MGKAAKCPDTSPLCCAWLMHIFYTSMASYNIQMNICINYITPPKVKKQTQSSSFHLTKKNGYLVLEPPCFRDLISAEHLGGRMHQGPQQSRGRAGKDLPRPSPLWRCDLGKLRIPRFFWFVTHMSLGQSANS